jgi:hypothetical protein
MPFSLPESVPQQYQTGLGKGFKSHQKKEKRKKHSTILKKQKVDHVWYPINGGNYEANLQPLTKKVL